MTLANVIIQYSALDESKKARFLTLLSYELTVWMRSSYDDNLVGEVRIKTLTGANELQHHISAEARHHLDQDPDRYPDAVLIRILSEKANFYQLREQFESALISCLGRIK